MKKYFITIVCISFIWLNKPLISSENYQVNFQKISVEDGLSQSSVNCILQDQSGFLWFGTQEGLNKYNGYNFLIYKHIYNNDSSVNHNKIYELYEDNNGYIWIGTKSGLSKYDPYKDVFKNYFPNNNNPLKNEILAIIKGNNNVLWIGTKNGLFNFYPDEEKFKQLSIDDHKDQVEINSLISYKQEYIIIGTSTGLYIWNENLSKFRKINTDEISVNALKSDNQGNVYIGTNKGLIKIDADILIKDNIILSKHLFLISDDEIRCLHLSNNSLWIGSVSKGLYIVDLISNEINIYTNIVGDQKSISSNRILSIYESQNKIIWIGTDGGGVNKFDELSNKFNTVYLAPNVIQSCNNYSILSICESNSGLVYIGTWGNGFGVYDQITSDISIYKNKTNNPGSLSDNNVFSIIEDREQNIWVGTYKGLNLFNPINKSFISYRHSNDKNSISDDKIRTIYEDFDGTIWVGTYNGGLNKFDKQNRTFESFIQEPGNEQSISNNLIFCIYEDSDSTLWIGTYNYLNKFDKLNKVFYKYSLNSGEGEKYEESIIFSILESNNENLWIGSDRGLFQFNRETGKFNQFTASESLRSSVIYGILNDSENNLWVSTNNGISKIYPETKKIHNYDITDGLQGNEFNVGAYYKNANGKMYFGGIYGYNSFIPEDITDNSYEPQIVITDIKIFNESLNSGDRPGLNNQITYTDSIELFYNDDVITFEFAALHYSNPEKNQYAYKLEGLDPKWNYVGNKRYATYTNLKPGNYLFKVKASNNDGVWCKCNKALYIRINPPFWTTWWFYTLEAFALALVIFVYIRLRIRRLRIDTRILEENVFKRTIQINRQKEKLEDFLEENILQKKELEKALFINEKQKNELKKANEEIKNNYELKEIFLANMSHEIRTPLNIIVGFTNLLRTAKLNSKQNSYLENIITSSNNLLVLINDILDFSKIEAGKLSLEKIEFNFKETINNIVNLVLVNTNEKYLDFFQVADTKIPEYLFGDPVRLHQILTNLIDNAIKFTNPGGIIKLDIDIKESTSEYVELIFKVSDTGIGMTGEQIKNIFESFTQARSDTTRKYGGTGLGLAIVKRLVELQEGSIQVESEINKGSSFIFNLKYNYVQKSKPKEEQIDSLQKSTLIKSMTILLVEDNIVNKTLAVDTINMYNENITIDHAENGQIAIDKVKENEYDLVIMDVQMPVLDGYKATEYIRKLSAPLNKIPILGMSAHAFNHEKEKCISIGMNDFITKPFEPKILFEKINELTGIQKK